MRRLIIFLFFLIASIALGAEMARHPGYALFTYGQWALELPLWFFLVALLLAFFLFHFTMRLYSFIRHFDWSLGERFARHRRSKALNKTQRGLLDMLEQQWSAAERHLLNGIYQSKNPVINYLMAAEAAHE